jgi:hypothetical protein
MRTYSSTTFAGLIPGGLPVVNGQGADSFPPFSPTPQNPVIERLFTVAECEPYLHMGARPILKAIASGKLVSSFCGRQHLISESSIAAYLEGQKGKSPYGKLPKQDAEK